MTTHKGVAMRKLDRQAVGCPPCIANPDPTWPYERFGGREKQEIRDILLQLQGQRCAYCERRTGTEKDEGHIEHFRKQADNPALTTTWSNMYWSCTDERCCGKHKDKCDRPVGSGPQATFDPTDLLDPCEDHPDEYIEFFPDGAVRPREGLSNDELRRAEETLRVFQLADHAYLRVAREDAVKPFAAAVDAMLPHGPQLVKEFVDSARDQIEDAPFSTAIKHYLRGLLS